jgi:hypothetical protein
LLLGGGLFAGGNQKYVRGACRRRATILACVYESLKYEL